MATPFTPISGSAIISATEFSLPNGSTTLTPQTTAVKLAVMIDPTVPGSAVAAGDQFRVQILDKINGGAQLVVWESFITGATPHAVRIPPRELNEGWDVRVKLIAGSARTLAWSLKEDIGDRNSLTIAPGAIASATFAAGALSAIAGAVWGLVSEGAETVLHQLRMLRSRELGNATIHDGNGTYAYRDALDTKNRLVINRVGTARNTTTADGT